MTIATGLALAGFLVVALGLGYLAFGFRQLRRLEDASPVAEGRAPLVSVIVAARNEERGIEAGLRSLLGLRYPRLELIVIDDRSTDGTSEIIARLAGTDPRLAPVRVEELPEGWLGKNHALWIGARRARGEWLLFTDADVVMEPDALARAVGHALDAKRDHVTVTPLVQMPGALLEAAVMVLFVILSIRFRPWRAVDPRSRAHFGVGAFNLVRREAYERAGTHERIALRPDDDIKLAQLLKRSGASQEVLGGLDSMRVAWYHSIPELVRGLEKNLFAGTEYRIGVALVGALAPLALAFGPILGVVAGTGPTRWLSAATIAATLLGLMDAARGPGRVHWSRALLYPIVAPMFSWLVIRTVVVNLALGGIRWRDTFYPLSALKRNRL